MADKNQIKNAIVLEGEAEYKRSLDNINRALKESKSAMKAAAAEYDGATDSMVAMYREGDALERHLENQKEALRLMGEQLDKVEAAYGANSREATELRTRINNLRAEMSKTQGEIKQFETRMEQAANAMEGIDSEAMQAGDAIAKIGSDAEGAQKGVGGLVDMLKDMTGLDMGGLTLAGGAAAAGAAAGAGIAMGNETLESWNQLAAYTGAVGDELERLKEDAREVYRLGVGESLGDISQAVATIYQMTGQTGTSLQDCTVYAIALRDTFDMDVNESARTAAVLMEEFGISGKEAYDLITLGAQNGADKNGNLLDTINEYAPYFKDAGKEADEMFNAIITGAQNGIYDVDKIGDAWKEFMLRVTSADEGPKEALETLGFAAEDVVRKIAEGGPAADLATQEIITALANVQDPYEQNRLAIELFGTQWEDTSGKVLPIFQSMDEGLDNVTGSAQALADVKYNDLDTAWEGLKRRVDQLVEPALLEGVNGLIGVMDNLTAAWDRFEQGDVAGGLKALEGGLGEQIEAQVEVAHEASADLRTELDLLNEQIDEAFASGDNAKAWTLEAQRQQLLLEITQIEQEAVAAMGAAGTATAEALGATDTDMETAAQTVGESAVTGLETGAEGMEAAAADAVSGAVATLYSGTGRAYNAGYATGEAYQRGYKRALGIASPSRVMQEAAQDTTSPLFTQFEEDEARLQEAGAALGAAFAGGYGNSFGGGGGALTGGAAASGGVSAPALAAAVREALVGLAWETDIGTFARLVEPGVSAATTQRAQATVRGQSAMTKRW